MLASLRGLKTILKNISPINETKLDKRGRKHICVHGGKEGFISETIRQSKITRFPSLIVIFISKFFSLFKNFR